MIVVTDMSSIMQMPINLPADSTEKFRGTAAYAYLKSCILDIEGYTIVDEDVEDGIEGGPLLNGGYCAGKEIWIGEFDDAWLKVAALAHEFGHSISCNPLVMAFIEHKTDDTRIEHSTLVNEAIAWEAGFQYLKSIGITLPQKAIDWAGKQLSTYSGYKG